ASPDFSLPHLASQTSSPVFQLRSLLQLVKMQFLSVLALGLGAASLAAAAPSSTNANDVNVFAGKNFYANKIYAKKVDTTIKNFLKKGDFLNAARARTIKRTGTFAWISKTADLADVPGLINDALLTQTITRKK